jgi:hypothetical protein
MESTGTPCGRILTAFDPTIATPMHAFNRAKSCDQARNDDRCREDKIPTEQRVVRVDAMAVTKSCGRPPDQFLLRTRDSFPFYDTKSRANELHTSGQLVPHPKSTDVAQNRRPGT